MWIIYEPFSGNIVSNGRLTQEQASQGLQEKEVQDIDIGSYEWDSSIIDFIPTKSVKLYTPLEFLQLFTLEERAAIRTSAKTDVIVEDFLATLNIVSEVNMSHSVTIQALQYMTASGLITPERLEQIRGL